MISWFYNLVYNVGHYDILISFLVNFKINLTSSECDEVRVLDLLIEKGYVMFFLFFYTNEKKISLQG